MLGKLEGKQSGGSVKDRIAYYMIKKAEIQGVLTKDKIILVPPRDTGIGLSMVAAAKATDVYSRFRIA